MNFQDLDSVYASSLRAQEQFAPATSISISVHKSSKDPKWLASFSTVCPGVDVTVAMDANDDDADSF